VSLRAVVGVLVEGCGWWDWVQAVTHILGTPHASNTLHWRLSATCREAVLLVMKDDVSQLQPFLDTEPAVLDYTQVVFSELAQERSKNKAIVGVCVCVCGSCVCFALCVWLLVLSWLWLLAWLSVLLWLWLTLEPFSFPLVSVLSPVFHVSAFFFFFLFSWGWPTEKMLLREYEFQRLRAELTELQALVDGKRRQLETSMSRRAKALRTLHKPAEHKCQELFEEFVEDNGQATGGTLRNFISQYRSARVSYHKSKAMATRYFMTHRQ